MLDGGGGVVGEGRVGWWGVVFGFDHIWQSHRGLRTFEKWPPTSVHLPTVSISLLFYVPAMEGKSKALWLVQSR